MNLIPKQVSYLDDVNLIVYHSPAIIQTIGYIHPLASLFEASPNFEKCIHAYQCFETVLNRYNIHSAYVTDVLRRNRDKLMGLAKYSSMYTVSEQLLQEKNEYITEDYRMKVLNKLDVESLLSLVYSRPNVYLKKGKITYVEIERIEIAPLANMIFCRDQQIVTAKGLVMGNTETTVRKFEKVVMKAAFDILKLKVIGEATGNQYIEGGDFMMISKDLSLIQIGIRSNMEGVKFLLDNDLIGTRRFGVVKDEKDRDQQRMHLDTIFNLIDEKNVILLDFEDPVFGKDIRRDIDVYEQSANGKYHLAETIEFYKFLIRYGFNIIKASHKEQLEFMINFLNVGKFDGKYVLVTSNAEFKGRLEKEGVDVTVEYLPEFKEVNKMHGSFHCITQVFR